jgi:hypothetical protein
VYGVLIFGLAALFGVVVTRVGYANQHRPVTHAQRT